VIVKINETFVSIQGEGPFAGTRCLFVRFSGCNLKCPFCDSKYATGTYINTSVAELVNLMTRAHKFHGIRTVVFTGGEPTMCFTEIQDAINRMDIGLNYCIETNGTIEVTDDFVSMFDAYVVSPKLMDHTDKAYKSLEQILDRFVGYDNVYIKPVVNAYNIDWWMKWACEHWQSDHVIFMPETPIDTTPASALVVHDSNVRLIIQKLNTYGLPCRVGPRLHVIYGVR